MASKTVIQGLGTPMDENPGGPFESGSGTLYSRNAGGGVPGGTVVPGVGGGAVPPPIPGDETAPSAAASVNHRPYLGFLYSISRSRAAEFWPLSQGKNKIGTDPSCDVVLAEGTVSSMHATLTVRQLVNRDGTKCGVKAYIKDVDSTNGTMLNGEMLDFEGAPCQNGDIITIGTNYEMYLILLDPEGLGLKVSENFVVVEEEYEEEDDFPSFEGDYPSSRGFGGPIPAGTVGLDGSVNQGGGTIGM